MFAERKKIFTLTDVRRSYVNDCVVIKTTLSKNNQPTKF